jgi:hypothetical protein
MATQQEVEKVEQQLAILKLVDTGPGLKDAALRALAEPGLFAYSELVEMPSIQKVLNTATGVQNYCIEVERPPEW